MERVCKKCGFRAPEEWFWKRMDVEYDIQRRQVCPACLQEERDRHKKDNRVVVKARNTLYTHSRKYGMEPNEFAAKYGWSIQQITHMFAHDYTNLCHYCHTPYETMENGLSAITLDIIDPEREPYFATNVRTCCRTCNTKKGHMTPEAWALDLIMWQRRLKYLKSKPEQLQFIFS